MLQTLKEKPKLNFHQKIFILNGQMHYLKQSKRFMFEEHPFSRVAQVIAFILHEAMSLIKVLPTKRQVKILKK